MAEDFDPYKALQVDPEADDEVIRAAYRGLARKYHPDVTPGPEAAARMAAINVAWGLIGRPGRASALRPSASGRCAAGRHRRVRRPRRGPPAPPPHPSRRRPRRCHATGHRDGRRPVAATTPRCAPPRATGPPDRHPGRPSGSVLNFGRYAGWSLGEIARLGHRVHRVARPGADRAPVPRRDRPDPAQGGPAPSRGRGAARTDAGCTAAAEATWPRRSRVTRVACRSHSTPRSLEAPPTPADTAPRPS